LFAAEHPPADSDPAQAPWLVLESSEPFVAMQATRPSDAEAQTPFRGMFAVGPKEISQAELTNRLNAIAKFLTPSDRHLNRINLQMRKRGDMPSVWDAIFEIRLINSYSVFGRVEVPP
jgi:hypothetical protein